MVRGDLHPVHPRLLPLLRIFLAVDRDQFHRAQPRPLDAEHFPTEAEATGEGARWYGERSEDKMEMGHEVSEVEGMRPTMRPWEQDGQPTTTATTPEAAAASMSTGKSEVAPHFRHWKVTGSMLPHAAHAPTQR